MPFRRPEGLARCVTGDVLASCLQIATSPPRSYAPVALPFFDLTQWVGVEPTPQSVSANYVFCRTRLWQL